MAYNQILLCVSPELQTAIDDTDIASTTWKTLTFKFELTDVRATQAASGCHTS